jgi:glyoxylase I family protein
MLMIKLTSVMVEDQTKALAFYTDVLGFAKMMDFPVGEYRWITVAAPGHPEVHLALEPNVHGIEFQRAMFAKSIPIAAFASDDLEADFERLSAKGVAFTKPPTAAGPIKLAILADTVGNLIQLYQPTR